MDDDMLLEFEKPVSELEARMRDLEARRSQGETKVEEEIKVLQTQYNELKQKLYANLTPWQRVQLARHPKRPYALDYLQRIASEFIELHGDRRFGDDHAIIGGLATIEDHRVMIVAQQKGRDTKENLMRNFGSPHPEGYRKALRLMQLAERFDKPVVAFIDTPGAYPGIGAEERGQ